jgi:hypothetical protein
MDNSSLLKLVKHGEAFAGLNRLLGCQWAPSGFNSHTWEYVVVRDKIIKDKIVRINAS